MEKIRATKVRTSRFSANVKIIILIHNYENDVKMASKRRFFNFRTANISN